MTNPTPSVTEEIMARALAEADGCRDWDALCPVGFHAQPRFVGKDYWFKQARVALAMKSAAPQHTGLTADDCFYEGKFFVATVSEDGREIGLDHPTDADWNAVKQAHIALRDRLNERLAQEDMCPHKSALDIPTIDEEERY